MVNDSTREYSVFISDEKNSVNGSGVLFYAGGDTVFVFTCAHVVEDLEKVRLFILKEIDASRDLYDVFQIDVPASQIVFSPLDDVKEENGEKTHTEDLAIIRLAKPEALDIDITDYFLTETRRNRSVYVQGYPTGVPEGQNQIEHLDCLHGVVIANPEDVNRFTIRLDEPFINSSDRVCELEGLSGSPVWDDNKEINGLLGLFTSAYGHNATLAKTHATKAQRLRSIMKERFEIIIERKLDVIPQEDVGGGTTAHRIVYDGTITEESKLDDVKWAEEELSGLRAIIDDLKLQKAIDKGCEIATDERYADLPKDIRRKVKQYLLYCYEIADMDEEFEALESEMREEGLLKDHDTLRTFTRSFMKKEYQITIEAAQHCIDTWDGSNRESLLSFAKMFLILAKAYTEDLPIEQTIGTLLDEHERFVLPLDEEEDIGFVYQMIGYVYGERYRDYAKSVRFLNRSYQVGFDSIILESLGAAYYNLGISDATDESGIIPDARKIDRKALYKARECFLMVIDKADRLFWEGTMRRVGMCVYNTFVFLQDNYRIITLYPDVLELVKPVDAVDENDFWRDVEMKYARIITQSGSINTDEFPHIGRSDRILLETMAKTSECSSIIEHAMAELSPDQMREIGLDRYIRDVLRETENNVRVIDRRNRVPVYIHMMNIYGRGMTLFGWDKLYKLKYCRERLQDCHDELTLEAMDNFIYEYEAPIEDVIKRFRSSFDKHKTLDTWQELNHLYIRHGMMDKADEMYKELLAERKELISDEPEYAYRAFIDYITMYRRDLKYALQCYLDAKEAFQDTDIQGFWELELMTYSNIFNNPERFEIERWPFVEKGLITEEQYHRTAFIAYLTNLNEEKAWEHNEYIRQYPHFIDPRTGMIIAHPSEIHFLNWIGAIQPMFAPPPISMNDQFAADLRIGYGNEKWHSVIDNQIRNQINVDRTIAIDSWGLFQLKDMAKIELLDELDQVYVSHMSIIQLHEELSRTCNQKIREVLDYLKTSGKIRIWSPGFRSQIEVRNVAKYFEPTSTVALGVEKNCLVVLGAPMVDQNLIDHYGNRIVRVNEFETLIRGEK